MSNFSAAQLRELQQIVAAAGTGRVSRTAPGSAFSLDQQRELQRIILAVTTDAAKGRYAGFGNPQVDTFNYPDNCAPGFPWTFDFVIPKNFQRWTSVHLSFKLRAFRRYVAAVNNSAVTSAGSAHFHTWVAGTQVDAPAYYLSLNGAGSVGGMRQSGGGGTPAPLGYQTATETQAGGAQASSFTTLDTQGSGHTHSVTPSTTLTTGIFEDTTPTSVTIKIDGTDYTTTLAGPWTADTVELDITKVMPTKLGVFHNIQLTPNQNGRITGELRFSYFVDASVIA